MKPLPHRLLLLVLLLIVAVSAAFFGFIYGRESASPARSAEEEGGGEAAVVAKVKTAPAKMDTISRMASAYGTVVAEPEEVQNVSVPFESRVRRVLVYPGQAVAAQADLVEIEPSPEAHLQLQEAQTTAEAVAKDLAQAQQRYDMKLATAQELRQAQQAVDLAQLKLKSLQAQGIEPKRVKAPQAGLVNKVAAQEGQIVAAGAPLVEVVAENRIEVKLSLDQSDIVDLAAGQSVQLTAVHGAAGKVVEGRIRLITRRVNPASRMVDVLVSLPEGSNLLLDTYVRGQIATLTKQALVVPRAAVLPEEGKHYLYTVREGKAVRLEVSLGLQNDQVVEILGDALKSEEPVVTEGNYELRDGMAVEPENAP